MHDLQPLVDLLSGRRLAVLTGAGCSTESGIPDYRGPETRKKARNPVQYRQFAQSADHRRHYWARSVLGFPRVAAARPNAGHRALAALERAGLLTGLVTQNVDRLHTRAGSRTVVELHGALDEVICLQCRRISCRHELQQRLLVANPGWTERAAELAPDGDAELGSTEAFVVRDCRACGGVLKPHVVFFGEGVPRERVEAAWQIVESAEVLLVVGSSLAVFSGFRFVRKLGREGRPVAVVNLGETRGDPFATVKLDAPAGEVLPALAAALGASPTAEPPAVSAG